MADRIALQATNAQILDAIRTGASSQYQARVPSATRGSVAETAATLQQYKPLMNEFVDALVNRIGLVEIRNRIYSNPLAEFKRGMMAWGSTIEDVYVEILTAKRYDPNATYDDVFKRNDPSVQSNFHRINRQDYYEVTVMEHMLRRAFLEDDGLQKLVGAIMDAPYTSDAYDEFLIMRSLFGLHAKNDQFFKVQVADVNTSTDPEADMKYNVRLIREYASLMGFMGDKFNAANVITHTPAADLALFVTPKFEAALDVEVLAAAFNMSKAEYIGRRVLIDDFGIAGCEAILGDKNLFVCADTYLDFTSIHNPKLLGWNYWLHHHGIYSMSRFCNAVMFTTETGSAINIPSIELTDLVITIDGPATYAEQGGELRLVATITGTVTPATEGVEVPQGVVWSIVGSNAPVLAGTFIDPEGVLHIDENEQNQFIVVSATSVYQDPDTPLDEQEALYAELAIGIGGLPDVDVPAVPVITAAIPTAISGTGEAGAEVTVLNKNTNSTVTVVVAAGGSWTTDADLGVEVGHLITAFQTDAAGNRSANTADFAATAE